MSRDIAFIIIIAIIVGGVLVYAEFWGNVPPPPPTTTIKIRVHNVSVTPSDVKGVNESMWENKLQEPRLPGYRPENVGLYTYKQDEQLPYIYHYEKVRTIQLEPIEGTDYMGAEITLIPPHTNNYAIGYPYVIGYPHDSMEPGDYVVKPITSETSEVSETLEVTLYYWEYIGPLPE